MKRQTTNLVAATVALLLTGSQCPTPSAERTVLVARSIGFMNLDYGAVGNRLARRTYTVFGGTAARSVGLIVNRRRLSSTNSVLLRSSDGTVVATLTNDDAGTAEPVIRIPGNVAIVEANWDGTPPVPAVSLGRVDVTTTAVSLAAPPPNGALQMSLNTPVELFFGATPITYYLWIEGVGASTVDVVLDGPGRVHVSDPVGGRIVLDAAGAPVSDGPQPLAVIDSGSGGVATFAPVSPRRRSDEQPALVSLRNGESHRLETMLFEDRGQ